jgi:signal transduction histidine kinase
MLLFFMDRDGITYQLFWPNATYWKLRSVRVFAAIGMALGVSYFVHILQVDHKWIRRASYSYVGLCLVLAVALLILPRELTNQVTVLISFGTPLLMLFLPAFMLRKNRTFAPYMLIAGLITVCGHLIYSLSVTDIIVANYWTENSMKISTLFEFTFLTFGIHQKIKEFHQSRLKAKMQLADLEKKSAVYRAVFETTNMMAHDVRRPLDKMTKFLQRMQRVPSDQLTQYVMKSSSSISEDIQIAESMLSEFLAIGRDNVFSRETNLAEFVPQIANGRYRYDLRYKGAVKADSLNLNRVFENLIKNARQATSKKTNCKYWIETKPLGDMVQLTVGNSGSSIERDDLSKIFTIFFTKGKPRGTGVGLAIVEKIIHEYGGDVWAESNGYTSRGEKISRKHDEDYVEFHMTLQKGESYEQTTYSSH